MKPNDPSQARLGKAKHLGCRHQSCLWQLGWRMFSCSAVQHSPSQPMLQKGQRKNTFSPARGNTAVFCSHTHVYDRCTQSIQVNVPQCKEWLSIPLNVNMFWSKIKKTWCSKYLITKPKNNRSGIRECFCFMKTIFMMNAVLTDYLTPTGTDNGDVHLLLGQPEKMMYDCGRKLFWHGSAEALNCSPLQRCGWIIPHVPSQSSSLHRDRLRHFFLES